MNIVEKELKKALSFYEIDDTDYLSKCLECINYINNNDSFKKRVEELYDILYNKKDYLIAKLWKVKLKEELFGNNYHSYVTNILLLMGYKFHIKNIMLYKLDDNQINIHKKRVKEALLNDIYEKNLDGIRISQMLWGSYFSNMRIIEVGRLQYEFVKENPLTNEKEECIKMHIPKDGELDINLVKESIVKSKIEIKKYFGLDNPKYYCDSWLLSKEVRKCIKEDSNIVQFQKLFDIREASDCTKDILKFVYGVIECSDYIKLKEESSLQRNLKQMLLNNEIIKKGIGRLKDIV